MTHTTSFTIPPGAPAHLLWEALTTPEHLRNWYGFRDSTLSECRVDLRPGGAWRCVIRMPDGSEHGFGGTYREIEPPRRLVNTFRYDGYPAAESVETHVLEPLDGGTLLTVTVLHSSVEHRDGHVASGMETGCAESHDRLAELLESMSLPQAGRKG